MKCLQLIIASVFLGVSYGSSLTLGRHYTKQQKGDTTLSIEYSNNNLKQVGFDNILSRYKIDGDETWSFYDQPNFEGLLFTATGPIGWTKVNPHYNDKVSSVRRTKEGSLTLGRHYTSKQKGDTTMLIEHATNNLKQVGFDNILSRYKIGGKETWYFYGQPNFEGLLFAATGPIGWTKINPRYNDKVSSVRVGKKTA